jgi:predicted nucleic acid-binding protein
MVKRAIRSEAVLTGGVLANVLVSSRLNVLTEHRCFRYVITPEVRDEINRYYSVYRPTVNEALESGLLGQTSVASIAELEIFAKLQSVVTIGLGECAALAAGIYRGMPVAIDDDVARKVARDSYGFTNVHGTIDIMIAGIRARLISIENADSCLTLWRAEGFYAGFDTFLERL